MHRRLALAAVALLALTGPGARAADPVPTLHLGMHAPFTGPAPVHAEAIQAGAQLYWRYLHDVLGVLVHGNRIEVHFEDDSYAPTIAVSACDKMATESGVIMLLGVSGTDQINACSAYADQRGIPYLSPGVQEAGLNTRETSYTLSMTYPAQSRIIAQFIVNMLGSSIDRYRTPPSDPVDALCDPFRVPVLDTDVPVALLDDCPPDPELNGVRIALVRQDSPNYDETEAALRSALRDVGTDLHAVYPVTKEGNETEAQRFATDMKAAGIDAVVTTTQPVFTLRLAYHARNTEYFPRYLMYGMTSGINAVARIGCVANDLHQASVFSPWPGWDAVSSGQFDPSFQLAADTYAVDLNTAEWGDVLLWMWGTMKSVHQILDAVGPDPARANILTMLDAGYSHSTGVYPDFSVDADNHFGADSIHRLEVDCAAPGGPQFLQRDAFVTGYPAS